MFPTIMKEQFGKDLEARNSLYKPFSLDTSLGPIKVQGVSNSCGCLMLNWKRMKAVIQTLEEEGKISYRHYKEQMDRAFNKGITHDTRKHASDGHMSSTISMYGELYLKYRNIDIANNFPFLSICDYSISEHIAGGGENGGGTPEGVIFLPSPTWKNSYTENNPRTT